MPSEAHSTTMSGAQSSYHGRMLQPPPPYPVRAPTPYTVNPTIRPPQAHSQPHLLRHRRILSFPLLQAHIPTRSHCAVTVAKTSCPRRILQRRIQLLPTQLLEPLLAATTRGRVVGNKEAKVAVSREQPAHEKPRQNLNANVDEASQRR